jgi:hypothetical protein
MRVMYASNLPSPHKLSLYIIIIIIIITESFVS